MKKWILKGLWMLFGAFSLCLFFYGLLFVAEAICQKQYILVSLAILAAGCVCMTLTAWISEEYEL